MVKILLYLRHKVLICKLQLMKVTLQPGDKHEIKSASYMTDFLTS
jgi:hypothetical protein